MRLKKAAAKLLWTLAEEAVREFASNAAREVGEALGKRAGSKIHPERE